MKNSFINRCLLINYHWLNSHIWEWDSFRYIPVRNIDQEKSEPIEGKIAPKINIFFMWLGYIYFSQFFLSRLKNTLIAHFETRLQHKVSLNSFGNSYLGMIAFFTEIKKKLSSYLWNEPSPFISLATDKAPVKKNYFYNYAWTKYGYPKRTGLHRPGEDNEFKYLFLIHHKHCKSG